MSVSMFINPAWIKIKRIEGAVDEDDPSNFFFLNVNNIESFIPFARGATQITMLSGSIIQGYINYEELIRKISASVQFLERSQQNFASNASYLPTPVQNPFPSPTYSG